MLTRLPVLAGLAALVVTVSTASAAAPASPRTWSQHWDCDGRPSVRVRTRDADVRIHTRENTGVEARVTTRGSTHGFFIGRRDPDVQLTRNGNQFSITVEVHGIISGIMVSSERLIVDAWVPRETDLTVASSDGNVDVGPLAGHIVLDTHDGNIEAHGLSGDVAMTSADGRIDASDLDGSLTLRARDGRARIEGRFDHLEMSASDASLDVSAERGSKIGSEWSLESHDGSIALRMPSTLAASLDAEAVDGHLVVDLPIVTRGRVRSDMLRGDLNGGGPPLRLRSVDGSIRVQAID